MSWVAVAIAGSAVVSGVMQNQAAKKGQAAVNDATNASISEQRAAREAYEQRSEPFRQIGLAAAPALLELLGIDSNQYFGNISTYEAGTKNNAQISDLNSELSKVRSKIASLQQGGGGRTGRYRSASSQIQQLQQQEQDLLGQISSLSATQGVIESGGATPEAASAGTGSAPTPSSGMPLLSEVNPLVSFIRDQGFQDIQESAAAGGNLRSGGTLQDLTDYNTNVAATIVPQLQQQKFNQLFNLLGVGSNAAAGQGSAALSTASNISGLLQNQGLSAQQTAFNQGQILSNTIGDLAGAYGYYKGVGGGAAAPSNGSGSGYYFSGPGVA